jgi:aryl carrier-like protein
VERALNLEGLAEALGEHPAVALPRALPTPAELQALLAEVEVRLFLRQPQMPTEVLRAGWYLHAVASSNAAFRVYTPERQRRAFQVSAHIFDLALADEGRSRTERLQLGFAAAVGYRRGELDPNATAVYRRLETELRAAPPVLDHADTLALEAGVALLGLDNRRVFQLVRRWRAQLAAVAFDVELDSLASTMYGPAQRVVDGVFALLQFLAFGEREWVETAQSAFQEVARGSAGAGDLDARWVASHLLGFTDEAAAGSVWSVLPPDVPAAARQAFTLSSPPVLTLWPPQRQLLTRPDGAQPLAPAIRRVVLSVPTSSGKTLLAQLFIVAHVATQPSGVCYVAPMRSLGREVRRALRERLRVLAKELGRDAPDFPATGSAGLFGDLAADAVGTTGDEDPPDVEVMTPERLAHLLRHDPQGVLDRFGLFVFDEVQLLAEQGRGFTLESLLAFLHWRTQDTPHRLVLLSAALGNRGQLMSWLDPDGEGLLLSSSWRGPRRLHAVFTTNIDWSRPTSTPVRTDRLPVRLFYPVLGRIRLRPAEDTRPHTLGFSEPLGTVAFRADRFGVRQRRREAGHSTPQYKMVARLVAALGHAGSVLVVTSTRTLTQSTALELATLVPEEPRARPLVDFVRQRLGPDHPLAATLLHGVAFHHAALPVDVLEELEEQLRSDIVRYMVCTTTLTEGVNLPVRTVVIHEVTWQDQPEDARLTGGRLLNALGRAGRAGRESEGWVVLVRAAAERDDDFDLLAPTDQQLEVRSRLLSPEALEALAAFEALQRERDDAVFQHGAQELNDFISFIWFVLAAEEQRGHIPEAADLAGALAATFAHTQLDEPTRGRWRNLAEAVRGAYQQTAVERRRRWSRTGTSIASARQLDALADQMTAAVLERNDADGPDPATPDAGLGQPEEALQLLAQLGVIPVLLELPERPRRWAFHATVSTRSAEVPVDPHELLMEWLAGIPVAELADRFLATVPDVAWRIEQMVIAITEMFEHFLAWTLGVLVELVNERLTELETAARLCPELPAYVRYGVDSPEALDLLGAGVRSRRLAHAVAQRCRDEGRPLSELRAWLGSMSVAQWRERFAASSSEILDLLEVARVRRGNILRPLLEEGQVTVQVIPVDDPAADSDDGARQPHAATIWDVRVEDDELSGPIDTSSDQAGQPVVLQPVRGEPSPSPLGVYALHHDQLLAVVPTPVHADLQAVLDTGFELELHLLADELVVALAAPTFDQDLDRGRP